MSEEAAQVPIDPTDLFTVDPDVPELSDVVLLYYFDGFIDAGAAGRLLATHLMDSLEHREIARFDVDTLTDYRSRRPPMIFTKDHWEEYETPSLAISLLHDAQGTPFLLLNGPEPDHLWDAFTSAVQAATAALNVRMAVTFHGIPMGIPHTRPLGVTAHATSTDLIEGYRPFVDKLQVPGSAAGLLELRMGEAGRAAAGFAVHVPHYLAQAAYPAAAVTLLEAVQQATGLLLPSDALREAGRRTDLEITRQVESSEEVAEVVKELEQQYDAFEAGQRNSLGAEADNMPTAEELGAEFERFLAEQQDRNDPPDR
jgi:predicted ATP-grasp superfamily ATP-dependent carboligase